MATYLVGGLRNDEIEGDDGDDTLYGGDATDTILLDNFANSGDDRLNGGYGVDTLYGGNGDDELEAGDGRDNPGDTGNIDRLYGGAGTDTLRGGNMRDSLNGGEGDDYAEGRDGDDLINGDAGSDQLNGDNGNDEILGRRWPRPAQWRKRSRPAFRRCGRRPSIWRGWQRRPSTGRAVTMSSREVSVRIRWLVALAPTTTMAEGAMTRTCSTHTLTSGIGDFGDDGGDASDTVTTLVTRNLTDGRFQGQIENITAEAGAGAITLTGTNVANTLNGALAAAAQNLVGLNGNDTYVIGTNDTVTEAGLTAGGIDTIQVLGTYTLLSDHVENLTLLGTTQAYSGTARANTVANVITGNNGMNTLSGLGGNDTLIGLGGVDTSLAGSAGTRFTAVLRATSSSSRPSLTAASPSQRETTSPTSPNSAPTVPTRSTYLQSTITQGSPETVRSSSLPPGASLVQRSGRARSVTTG